MTVSEAGSDADEQVEAMVLGLLLKTDIVRPLTVEHLSDFDGGPEESAVSLSSLRRWNGASTTTRRRHDRYSPC